MYKSIASRGFGSGLNLRDGVDVVNEDQAIDALNVLFTTRGSVTQRSGFRQFTAVEGTNRFDSLTPFYQITGTKQVVAGAGNRLDVLNASGAIVASSTAPTASPHFFQRFGGPTGEYLYIANGADTVRRWDGAAFTTPTYVGTTPTGRFLGISPTDARLVSARFSGAVAGNNPSTVRFSHEGDPLSFDASDYEDLTPGDGEQIMGMATWRDQLFVFKQSKFFVFYGTSVDDQGAPKFNFRPVDASVGLLSSRALAIAENGVYFLDRTGVYFTNGGDPTLISANVEPIFTGTPSVYYHGGILNDASATEATMTKHDNRLFLSFPADASVTNNRQLVYDVASKWWSLFDLPAGPMIAFRPGSVEELVFGYSGAGVGTLKHLGRYVVDQQTTDNASTAGVGGTAITAYWQGGWTDYGIEAVKTVREAKIGGSGLVTVQWFRDYRQSFARSVVVQLSPTASLYNTGLLYDSGVLYGPSLIIHTQPIRKAIRGAVFSIRFSNSDLGRAFQVHRLNTHIREARVSSVVEAN